MSYAELIRASSPRRLQGVLQRLSTPQKVQDYLDSLPINFETHGETYMSPLRVVEAGTAHCFEGALLAAAAFAYHDDAPLLMDLRAIDDDEDHVVAPFRQNGYWGAISKTNHAILRYRDPVYATCRELALSYVHEYALADGTKTLREASRPFSLRRFRPEEWLTAGDELGWLVNELDDSPHFPVVPKKNLPLLRKISKIERKTLEMTEWSAPRGFKKSRPNF